MADPHKKSRKTAKALIEADPLADFKGPGSVPLSAAAKGGPVRVLKAGDDAPGDKRSLAAATRSG